MIPNVYEVTKVGLGLLFVMPKPSSEWLDDDIKYLSKLDINVVVSLLERPEAYELGLNNEGQALKSHGLEFVSYEIKDRGLPSNKGFNTLVETVYENLESGKNVAIHCRAGIGRTGMLASCLLIKDGFSAQVAIDMVSASRGVPIPDTFEQFDFICEFEQQK